MTITDKEYVRILKYCNTTKAEQHCNTCPLYDYEKCTVLLLDGAAELIKRLQTEYERLQTEKENLRCVIEDLSNNTEYAKEDAIKEFAEKVKEKTYHYYDSDIDELAKEMIKSEVKDNDR